MSHKEEGMENFDFVKILEQYKNVIFKICNTFCYDTCNRKDLEQEIIYQIYKSLKKFKGEAKLSTWIYKVALNTAISFSREEDKHTNNRIDINHLIIAYPESDYDTETDKNIEKLFQYINDLDELDRAIIILYLEKVKYKEIAAIMGITETNVSTKINRIKNILRKKFTHKT